MNRRCAFFDLNRSGIYYKPVPQGEQELELMRQIDEIHLAFPFTGTGRLGPRCGGNGCPEIFNTDKGRQVTAKALSGLLR